MHPPPALPRDILLHAAATCIAEGQDEHARRYLDTLLPQLQLPADLSQHIFATALAQRLDHCAARDNLYLQALELPQIELFNLLARHFPLVGLAGRIGNALLAGYIAGRESVTVLDLGIGSGQQELALLERLHSRGALPRRLTIIAIEPGADSLHTAERSLSTKAQALGLSFEFIGCAAVAEALTADQWKDIAQRVRASGSDLLVNAAFAAHHIQSTGQGPGAARDAVLRQVRELNPRAIVLLEPDSDHFSPDFGTRFAACWQHFGAIFGLVDRLPITPAERDAIKLFFSREIEDILANAEDRRSERHETTEAWIDRLQRAGFEPLDTLPFELPASAGTVALHSIDGSARLAVDGVRVASVICATTASSTANRAGPGATHDAQALTFDPAA